MNSVARRVANIFRLPSHGINNLLSRDHNPYQIQQWRGIRVKVFNGNLEQALSFMQSKMRSSGIERLISREQRHHIKNSEKRVLARKSRERRIQSQELSRKLKVTLSNLVRGQ